jgi:YidC/Oxa1 family membrane protein insertase
MEKFLRFTLVFFATYFLLSLFLSPAEEDNTPKNDISITLSDENPTIGDLISVSVANNTDEQISLGKNIPPEKIIFQKYSNGEWESLHIQDNEEEVILNPHSQQTFEYPEQNTSFFTTEGKYRVSVKIGEKNFEEDILIEEPGFWKTVWRVFFWKPVYNLMIACMNITALDLGWAIILVTIIIKLALFVPTQKGMKSQRKMQKLQPELKKIKLRNAGNQQKIAMESMELWKKHNVNPFSSILPILLQFPFLIALFYVVQNGLLPHNEFFLYPIEYLKNFDYHNVQTMFLGLIDLIQSPWQNKSMLWLPVIIAITQYFAMKLSFARMEKAKKEQKKEKGNSEKTGGFMEDFQEEFQKMNGVFIYLFPAMILIFSAAMPAGVGIYWLVSTLFSIGQQYVVNREIG